MAFNTINNSEFQGRKLYIGYAPVKVLAVNPDKQTIEKYFGPQQNDPNYISSTELNGKDTKQVRIEFILEAKKPETNEPFYTRLSFFLTKGYARNKAATKIQVIDTYGRTVWATNEDVENHKIPVFTNGFQAKIDKNFRPLILGEDRLIKFIRALFCLNEPEKWDPEENKYVPRVGDDLAKCEGILDKTKDFFNGDYSELENAIKMAENNTVYVLFGVKTNSDGRQFQTVYNSGFVRKNRRKDSVSSDFEKALSEFSPNDTEFATGELKEYNIKPTDFGKIVSEAPEDIPDAVVSNTNAPVDDLPFDDEGWNV